MTDRVRLDKWLWAARFYKTRSLASQEITKGRVMVNEAPAKPAREVSLGDVIDMRRDESRLSVQVVALSAVRGPATVARTLYVETEESIARRQAAAERRRLAPEPAASLSAGRPTKRDRRLIDRVRDPQRN